MYVGEIPTFRRKISPPSSRSRNTPIDVSLSYVSARLLFGFLLTSEVKVYVPPKRLVVSDTWCCSHVVFTVTVPLDEPEG
jgi:hypothetical protein